VRFEPKTVGVEGIAHNWRHSTKLWRHNAKPKPKA